MTLESAKQHIEQVRRERFWLDDATRQPSQNPLLGMLRRALTQLSTGIFEHSHHYVFELTQNADDNNYPSDADHFLKFILLEDDPTGTPGSQGCLCVLNDETGFEREHVESLCDIGNSTKKGNREGYIGEKGIGFKSVFLISDRPHVISNGYGFHFRRDDCDAGLGYIVPHLNDQVPTVAEGSPTAILLPLRSASGVDVAKQLADIEPECILFLRRLRRIELVSAETGLNRTVRCSGAQGFVNLDADGTRTSYFVHRADHTCAQIHEPLREGVTSTQVTVALPLTAPEATDGRVFAFLPTEARTGFPFLINADFLLPASRERIFDTPEWNVHLVQCAAATLVEAFDSLRSTAKFQTVAYRFIPTIADLLPGMSLFAPLVEAALGTLRQKECVLSQSGECVFPTSAYFAGPLTRRLLADAPPKLASFRLVHPDLENYRERLEPLGVQTLLISQLLDICSDDEWLCERKAEWWETLFDLLSQNSISSEMASSFPLLRCRDGVCRRPHEGVFFHADGQPTPHSLPPGWPAAHLFDADLQNRLQQKPAVWAWLTRVAGLHPFSVQSYIIGPLVDWMCGAPGPHLINATHFMAENLAHLDDAARRTLRQKMPWLLSDNRLLLAQASAGKELVTPECMEGDSGWNWVFISEHDRAHFWTLSDAYVEVQTEPARLTIRKLMEACGATDLPDPARLERANGQVDWGCPRWLRDLNLEQPLQNLDRKAAALERWIGRFKPDEFPKFLSTGPGDGAWTQHFSIGDSELGTALRTRPWLRSTKGLVRPSLAFVDEADIREFLHDSVAYTASKLHHELLGKLGVRLRLSPSNLIALLRQMRDSGRIDEALIVRIYRRLQTSEFNADAFRLEPLIFLARPSAVWRQTEGVFWKDAGDVFDEFFGYAELTYGDEELHGFFTDSLGVSEEVSEQQLAEVWAQMSGGESPAPDVVEKRLSMILPKLAVMAEASEPPPWWSPLRRQLKVWTAAKRFEVPASVFAPDDTLAEEAFAETACIAWVPNANASVRLNRLLLALGCRSLAKSLRSRAGNPVTALPSTTPRLLTPATKELLVCWVCAADGWSKKRQQLEQLLRSDEAAVSELRVEYWLDGDGASVSSADANAFWASAERQLYLRQDATAKAQQSAAATSIAAQLGRPGKQGEDTVYRLLGLEVLDAARELRERKWEPTPDQKTWLLSFGYTPAVVAISMETASQNTRRSRPAITQRTTPANDAPGTPQLPTLEAPADERSSADESSPPSSSVSNQPDSDTTRSAGLATGGRHAEPAETKQPDRSEADEPDPVSSLKPSDAETEFVHVTGHTRRRPRRERQQTGTAHTPAQEQHPLAGISQATKAAIEEAATQVIMRQFELIPGLREFKAHDERKRNQGYDVLALKPGHALRIEIKAHLREAKSVFVTQREWHQSKQRNGLAADDRWELWNVENLAADAGKVRITRYSNLPDDARTRESGYWVDLTVCSSQNTE